MTVFFPDPTDLSPLQLFHLTSIWGVSLTQSPEMSFALGRWALKEALCQKPLTQLPLRCDLGIPPGPRRQLVSHFTCEPQFPLTEFPFSVCAPEQPRADWFSDTWSADVRWAFVNFRGLTSAYCSADPLELTSWF